MQRVPQTSETYARMYAEGGLADPYSQAYKYSPFYPLFRRVYRELNRLGGQRVLDVGCGVGEFAALLQDRLTISYRGFDFNRIAVDYPRRHVIRLLAP
jgi:SAM-dependent methyltransferase